MKYVVTLEKTLIRTVVVDASSDDDCDRKLRDGDIEREWVRSVSNQAYGDWSYNHGGHYTVEAGEDLITCAGDIARLYGYDGEDHLERALFKYTDCGMCAEWDSEKITLVGYVEGADCDGPSETLYFPFTVKKLREVMDELETAADEMWHEWNDAEECEGTCIDEGDGE